MGYQIVRWITFLSISVLFAASATAITLDFVTVGAPGNEPDARTGYGGYGKVDYVYQIGKYEVTTAQYVAFLNAVAATDTYGLYDVNMWNNSMGCKIERLGSDGSYTYQVAQDRANRPVNYVSWGDVARFINWLHNGQPSGPQNLSTTEDGAYYLNGATTKEALQLVTRKAGAKFWIPNQDEWYKAAFYDPQKPGGPGYWDYATRSDSVPSNVLTDPDVGNTANYKYSGTGSYTIGAPYYCTPVGEFENSAGPWGTFDQNGNLFEWVETGSGDVRYTRGGSFIVNESQLKANYTGNLNQAIGNYHIGFRVATIPEPGSLALLAVAATAWLLWRKRNK